MRSLKSKLIFGISLFIVLLLTVSAFLQVREKEKELINDIYLRARSFAELTADKLVADYKLYLVPDSFVYFNRNVRDILAKNEDIAWLKLVNYSGQVLYDSEEDREAKYSGPIRQLEDADLLEQIKSRRLSVKTGESSRVIFFQKNEQDDGVVSYLPVDQNDNAVEALASAEKVDYLVQAADEEFSVIYGVSYQALASRVQATQIRILLLAVFGVALGILLAIVFGSTITKPLAQLRRGAEILATGDLSHRVKVKTRDEVFQLAETFNKMAADLQESTKALVYKERVGKELELARQIQERIIPMQIPKITGLDLAAGIIPAEEIGGDCYDFLMPSEDEMVFYLGDVTGHGVPSGIVVSIANALFYAMAGVGKLDEILVEVNSVLKAKTMPNMFVTLVLMRWLAREAKFSYASAGHEQIVHYRAKTDEVELLPSGGMALGMVKDIAKLVQVREIELQSGDVLFIYSDGIPEAWRNESEMYGMDRLKRVVREYGKSFPSALAIKNALISDVYLFRQGFKQMDDITCIVVKKT